MKKSSSAALVEQSAKRLATEMGLRLLDIEFVKESAGQFLRFFIDRDGGVTLDDCERFHRAMLPHAERVEYDYMEVASPGADRPLKRREEFERAIESGILVDVKLYRALNGKKRFEGVLTKCDDAELTLALRENPAEELAIQRKLISRVAPLIEVDEADDLLPGED